MARLARPALVTALLPLLRRRAPIVITGLVAVGSMGVGCTQNFGIFEPSGTSSSSVTTGSGGTGGASSTTTTATGGAGGTSTTTTTTTTTGTGGTTTTTTTTTSGTGGMGPEECTNGLDDDKNGKIDCEDPACAAFTCVPTVPAPWNGPAVLFDGDPAMVPGSCPMEHPLEAVTGHQGLMADPATCSACSCSSPNVFCGPGILAFRNGANCAGSVGMANQPNNGQCGPISPPAQTNGYAGQDPMLQVGACSPSGGTPTIPPVQWQSSALACTGGGQGTGCGATAACVAKSAAPFGAGFCIWRDGDKNCPASFPQKHVYNDNVVDNRDCSACTCGDGTGTCTVTTTVYASADCSGDGFDVPNDQTCVAGAIGASIKPTVTKSASCPSAGGQPTGSAVVGNQMTTVCCTP